VKENRKFDTTNKQHYHEINIARGIAIMCVILGHSFPDAQTGISNPVALWIHSALYSFHMGCFFLLSGFVSARKLCNGQVIIKNEISNKFKRLIVPYLFYSVITIGLKQVFSAFANNTFDITEFWKIIIGVNPNGGMWYLWTLFVISFLFVALSKLKFKSNSYIILGIAMYILMYIVQSGFWNPILKYSIFFVTGVWVHQHYEIIKQVFDVKISIPIAVIAFIIFVSIGGIPYIVTGMIGTYVLLAVSFLLMHNKNTKIYKVLYELGNYSYDIYLLSYFIQVPIRVICWRLLGLPYVLVVLAMLVLGATVPWVASKNFIRKIPIANKILLGN